jgi:hypothetical protein
MHIGTAAEPVFVFAAASVTTTNAVRLFRL